MKPLATFQLRVQAPAVVMLFVGSGDGCTPGNDPVRQQHGQSNQNLDDEVTGSQRNPQWHFRADAQERDAKSKGSVFAAKILTTYGRVI